MHNRREVSGSEWVEGNCSAPLHVKVSVVAQFKLTGEFWDDNFGLQMPEVYLNSGFSTQVWWGFFGYAEDATGGKNNSQQTCLRLTREETEATE